MFCFGPASVLLFRNPKMLNTEILQGPCIMAYLAGQSDFVSRLARGLTGVIVWLIGAVILLTKPPRTLQVEAIYP